MEQSLTRTQRRRRNWISRAWGALATHQSRAQLGRLDAHLLRDIGLTPEEALREIARPVWDVPIYFRKK